jgi:protein-disulfide isomerase
MSSKRRKPTSVVVGRRGPSTGLIVGVVVVVVFAVIVGVMVFVTQRQVSGPASVPPNATAAGVPIGRDNAPATVDIYLDFQCPVCREYEQQVGPTVDAMIANGSAKVIYHPLAFLDRMSRDNYSTRASSAAGCAAADKVFPAYAKALYANQPEEGGPGLPESQLIALGQQAGAGSNFGECVKGNTYNKWAAKLTEQASVDGINGTPTVKVNGKQIGNTEAELKQAVASAGGK